MSLTKVFFKFNANDHSWSLNSYLLIPPAVRLTTRPPALFAHGLIVKVYFRHVFMPEGYVQFHHISSLDFPAKYTLISVQSVPI